MKITSSDQIYFFRDNEIIRIESTLDATLVHLLNGTTTEILESIAHIEAQLAKADLIRLNDNHIVNLKHVASISKGSESFIVLDNGEKLPIEASRKGFIVKMLLNYEQNDNGNRP